jgi:glutathione S-transferase
MHELILHHYPTSPFAEKARLLLGFKQLSWHSVLIPAVMPKPDLTALTGGYRKTPVLQIGADIYCDTALIARRLEAEKATPALFLDGQEFNVASFAQWADSVVFQHAVSLVFQPESIAVRFAALSPEAIKGFVADRSGLFSGGSASRLPAEQARHQWPTLMARLQQQLAREEGDFLFGAASIADFAMAHCLWFLKGTAVTAPLVDAYPQVTTWLARVLSVGHGSMSPMDAATALDIARAATPAALPVESFDEPNGLQLGQRVNIAATDYGVDPVQGELLFAGREELIVRREDPRAGVVHVHFPRWGFRIEALA